MTNIQIRLFSGLLIGLIFISTIFFARAVFNVLLYLIMVFMMLEWYQMTKDVNKYLFTGLAIIPPSVISLFLISDYDESGWLLLTYFCSIWTVDTMAMAGGKFFGGAKLAPTLSPNKTLSGLISGVLSSTLIVILLTMIPSYHLPYSISINIWFYSFWFLLAITAQISDLFISFFKRKFNLKDSGNIIPGHGGMLDRFDSIILTSPMLLGYLKIYC